LVLIDDPGGRRPDDLDDRWLRELFKRSRPTTAVDEIVRYSSPVAVTQRSALRDIEMGEVTIRAGQGLFYGSANDDEAVYDAATAFDITRTPNPHLGFGGNGPHICLGASLARLELRLVFDAIADIMPNVTKHTEPRRLRSSLVNGVKRFDLAYR
jgi:cholest-4-en-3-one 26-monooxygenase